MEAQTFSKSWWFKPVYLIVNSQSASRFRDVGNDYLAEQGKILSVREMPWSLSICDDVTQMIIEDVNQLIVDNRSLVNSAYTTCKLWKGNYGDGVNARNTSGYSMSYSNSRRK